MKILVINTGSSSIKYKLFDMMHHTVLASGLAEKIGETAGELTHNIIEADGSIRATEIEKPIPDHRDGLSSIVKLLVDNSCGVIGDETDIDAVGHRVVHGGETFQSPTIIDKGVVEAITRHTPLAPLHNPSNLTGISVALSIFPHTPQVAVFDTAFHQTLPQKAYTYAIPFDLYKNNGVRRYGFHGTSHAYVAERFAAHLGRSLDDTDLITIHLGNGASMAAIKKGKCVDTTMGLTPLEGLVMGTRCGDTDPALPFFLADHLKMPLGDIDTLLNKESGLKGICGSNDMREVLERKESGDTKAGLAVEIYCYRIKKYVGAYFAALGRVDGIVFTAGVGENAPEIRAHCCAGLENLGIAIDPEKNQNAKGGITAIEPSGSRVKVMVIPTDEELKIARETEKVLEQSSII